jgi:Co/Zn/Cd efflux system component
VLRFRPRLEDGIKSRCGSAAASGSAARGQAAWAAFNGTVPDAATMGGVGFLGLVANVGVAFLLYAFREGDANMRSVWLCSRNDAIGNVAVLLAALGVFGTGTAWPDLAVAVVMSVLGLTAAMSVVRQSQTEIRNRHRVPVHGAP